MGEPQGTCKARSNVSQWYRPKPKHWILFGSISKQQEVKFWTRADKIELFPRQRTRQL